MDFSWPCRFFLQLSLLTGLLMCPAFSAVEISGAKTKHCGGGIVKNLGLLSSKSWWLQGQWRFWIWSSETWPLQLPPFGWNVCSWVSCFATTFVLAQDHDAATLPHPPPFISWNSHGLHVSIYIYVYTNIHIYKYICKHEVYLSLKV